MSQDSLLGKSFRSESSLLDLFRERLLGADAFRGESSKEAFADRPSSDSWAGRLEGWLGEDPYSVAWVAMVPSLEDPNRPAWPAALEFLRSRQLPDGGWGDPFAYYPHERAISTLAALAALRAWPSVEADDERVLRALAALRRYAQDYSDAVHEPIGYELTLPRLIEELRPHFPEIPPLMSRQSTAEASRAKLSLIGGLRPDPTSPRTWWVSMEMLPEQQLSELDDSYLDAYGSIATSTAATAAYLKARRRAGHDSARASCYLGSLLKRGNGGVPFCWPAEVFDRLWSLDAFRRAGFDPREPFLQALIDQCQSSWGLHGEGISYSDTFPVPDSDHTVVGFSALQWAGRGPSDKSLLHFWEDDHFVTYHDERSPSVSANIHGLTALRSQPGFPHRDLATRLTRWLADRIKPDTLFVDKWHFSPIYPVSRAIPAFAGWDNGLALQCMDFIVRHQRPDGGWGWFERSTLEETSHAVIALAGIQVEGPWRKSAILLRASQFLQATPIQFATEKLWIGKTLYQPRGIVEALAFAAETALERLGYMAKVA